MATPQNKLNQSFIDFLMRKKQQEQQQGGWSERTGIDSIDNILRPSAFPRLRSATQDDSQVSSPPPQINPAINPYSRVADMPVTDTLPPEQRGFQTPELGMRAITAPNAISRPRIAAQTPTIASPTSPIIDAARSAESPTIAPQPPTMADRYMSQATPVDDSQITRPRIAEAPSIAAPPMLDQSGDTRPRIADPTQFLINRYQGSLTDQPNYGVDKHGQPRTEAKRGFMGRLGAFAKAEGEGLLEGRGLLPSLPNAVHAAINPDINAKQRLEREQEKNLQAAASQIGMQGAQARVEQEQANADWLRRRPDIMVAQANARTLKAQQDRVKANLQMRRGQALNPNNPQDAQLLQDAADAGYQINPDEWNNSARNEVTITKVDPNNPTQTRRVQINKVTGEERDLGQAGYVSPVDSTTGVSANVKYSADQAGQRQQTGIVAADKRQARSETRADQRQSAGDVRAAQRQEESDRKAATSQLNLANSKRVQAARERAAANSLKEGDPDKQYYLDTAEALDSEANDTEQNAVTNYGSVIEEVPQSASIPLVGDVPVGSRYRIRARSAAPQNAVPQKSSQQGVGPLKLKL